MALLDGVQGYYFSRAVKIVHFWFLVGFAKSENLWRMSLGLRQ